MFQKDKEKLKEEKKRDSGAESKKVGFVRCSVKLTPRVFYCEVLSGSSVSYRRML